MNRREKLRKFGGPAKNGVIVVKKKPKAKKAPREPRK